MNIRDVLLTTKHWVSSWLPSRKIKERPIDKITNNDNRNIYELKPQTPLEDMSVFLRHPIRFLGNDGGVRSGVIIGLFPSNRRGHSTILRVLDIRRNEIYNIPDSEIQIMKKRID